MGFPDVSHWSTESVQQGSTRFWHGFVYDRNFCSIKEGKQLDGLLDPESEQSVSLLCLCHFLMKKYITKIAKYMLN